jgi:hypothetical protein
LGSHALRRIKTGSFNTAIGSAALHNNENASWQTAIGYTALLNLRSGQDNFALGDFTFRNLDSSSFNVAVGSSGFTLATRANYNTAIGNYIRQRGARGDANTLVGYGIMRATGSHTDTADNNTALGFEALYSNRGGDGNVAIGYRAGYSELGSNQLYIDNSNTTTPLIKGDFLQDTLRINGRLSVASIDSTNNTVPNLVTWDRPTGRFLTIPYSSAGGVGVANRDSLFWGTRGNSIANPDSSFIGTTSNQPLYFKTNNQHALAISTNGNLGIGTKTPLYKLQVSDPVGSSLQFAGRLSRSRDIIRYGGYINTEDGQNVIVSASSDSGATYRNILVERDGNIGLGTSNGIQGWDVGRPALRIYYDGRVGVASNSFLLGNFGGPLNSSSLSMSVSNVNEFLYAEDYPNGQNYYSFGVNLTSATGQNKRPPLRISAKELEFYTGGLADVHAGRFTESGNLALGTTTDDGFRLRVNGKVKIDTLNFLPNRDTVLTYDPATKQIMATRISGAGGGSTASNVRISSDLTPTSSTGLIDAPGLSFPVVAGTYYKFRFMVPFRSSATGNGIRLSLAVPAFTVFSATAEIPNGADGTGTTFRGWITSSNDLVLSAGVQAINTDYIAIVEGVILATSNGNIQLRYGSELTTATITLRNGALGTLEPY